MRAEAQRAGEREGRAGAALGAVDHPPALGDPGRGGGRGGRRGAGRRQVAALWRPVVPAATGDAIGPRSPRARIPGAGVRDDHRRGRVGRRRPAPGRGAAGARSPAGAAVQHAPRASTTTAAPGTGTPGRTATCWRRPTSSPACATSWRRERRVSTRSTCRSTTTRATQANGRAADRRASSGAQATDGRGQGGGRAPGADPLEGRPPPAGGGADALPGRRGLAQHRGLRGGRARRRRGACRRRPGRPDRDHRRRRQRRAGAPGAAGRDGARDHLHHRDRGAGAAAVLRRGGAGGGAAGRADRRGAGDLRLRVPQHRPPQPGDGVPGADRRRQRDQLRHHPAGALLRGAQAPGQRKRQIRRPRSAPPCRGASAGRWPPR